MVAYRTSLARRPFLKAAQVERLACQARRLLLWLSIDPDDEAIAAPKFDVVTFDKVLRLLGCFNVVGAIQRLESDLVSVGPDGISHVLCHP